ncbi:MAG: nitroreductase family protein [Lachnospiraceae bacterium]|nr:nitroreductase family protein [Lachnospiraceae bacterium]
MLAQECIKGRRSIRKFKTDAVSGELLASIVETASYAPSWKNTQITRYVAVSNPLKDRLAEECCGDFPHNMDIIKNAPMLIAVSIVKNRSGFDRDGSYTTRRGDSWQMFDAGIASEAFCLAAYEAGLGTVILGIFDDQKVTELLELPEDREVVALIPIGYPDETPSAPKRKTVDDLLTFK